MTVRPKDFVAACDFSAGQLSFVKGDVIPHGRLLATLLTFGDKFVVTARKGSTQEGADNG